MSSYKTRARDKGNINNDYVKATRAGTTIVNGSSLSASNLQANMPVKTDNALVLQSTKLEISDTNGLQTALDSGVLYQGTLPAPIGALVKISDTTGNVENSNITETDVNNKVSKSGDTMTGNLNLGSNDIDSVGNIEVITLDGVQLISGTNAQDLLLNNAGFNISIPSCNLDLKGNDILDVNDLYIDRLFTTAPATEIQVENTLRMRGNNIVDVNNIQIDTFSVNNLPAILFNDDVSLFNNNIVSAGDIKTTSFSSTDIKSNDIDVNANIDLQTTRNIKNCNNLQTQEIKATDGVSVNFQDDIDMGQYEINNCNELRVSSISSAINPDNDVNLLNTLDLNNNDIENVASINGLTPSGGVYSGISDGNVITQASGQSDLLPVSFVGSLNIPADGFKVGDAYHLVVAGIFPSENKGDDITIEIKQNGTSLGVLTLELKNPDATPSNFEVEADFIIRSVGTTGSLASNIDFTFNEDVDSKFEGTRSTTITTIDTETASTLSVLASVNGAGSSIQSRLAYLRKQY